MQRSNTKREGMKQKKDREAVQRERVLNKRKTEKQYKGFCLFSMAI